MYVIESSLVEQGDQAEERSWRSTVMERREWEMGGIL